MDKLFDALTRNQYQVLTPELINGLYSTLTYEEPSYLQPNVQPAEYMDYIFRVERLQNCLEDFAEMNLAHWNEVEKDRGEFNADYRRLSDLEKRGSLLVMIMRHSYTGEAVGNLMFYVNTGLQNQRLSANEGSFYIKPAHRKGFAASGLIKFGLSALRSLGVSDIFFSYHDTHDIAALLKRCGFKPHQSVYIYKSEN